MKLFSVNNYNIFKGEQELYFSLGDDHLFKVAGEHAYLIEVLFQKAKLTDNVETLLQLVYQDTQIDMETIELGYDWLRENGMLQVVESIPSHHRHIKCLAVGFFNNDHGALQSFLETVGNGVYEFNIIQTIDFSIEDKCEILGKPDVIFVFSPFLVAGSTIKSLAAYVYAEDVTIIHVGFNSNYMTLGPILNKEKDTPCLECYYKRKMQNLTNLKEQMALVHLTPLSKINTLNVFNNNYGNIAAELLKIELDRFFQKQQSFLVGRFAVWNKLNFEVNTNILYRVPTCDICGSSNSIIYPFN